LIIADPHQPLAIAGIIGLEHSGITGETKTVVIESAVFNPQHIRKTRQKLGILTDSAYRFEHGTSYETCDFSNKRAVELVTRYANGRFTYRTDVYKKQYVPKKLMLSQDYVNKILATKYSIKDISETLSRLGMDIQPTAEIDNKIVVNVPSFRLDINEEIDLVEEVARIQGYENIPMHYRISIPEQQVKDPLFAAEKIIRTFLCSQGIFETINYSLIKNWDYKPGVLIELKNPISTEWKYLRPSMLPGLLKNIVYNYNNNKTMTMKFYETGKVFCQADDGTYTEKPVCAMAITGSINEPYWGNKPVKTDFHYVSGMIQKLLSYLGCTDYKLSDFAGDTVNTPFIPEKSVKLLSKDGSVVLGSFGIVDMSVHNKDFDQEIYYAELYLDTLLPLLTQEKVFKPYSRLPRSGRDIALIVPDNVTYAEIHDAIKSQSTHDMNIELKLFDVYANAEKIGRDKKSMAITLYFSNPERTLTSDEINSKVTDIINRLNGLSITLRT
jgi:phenylalanyl-tRNA synthetase beta chain